MSDADDEDEEPSEDEPESDDNVVHVSVAMDEAMGRLIETLEMTHEPT